MATTLAACELSGYSNSSQTLRWFSLVGSGFSSSLIKPSSSLHQDVVVVVVVGSAEMEREKNAPDTQIAGCA